MIGFVSWFADAVVSAADPNVAIQRVTAAKPTRKTLTLMTTQPGWIKAFEEAPLHPRIAGYVKSVNVDIGDHVDLGQVLIVVDAPELQNEVMQHETLVELAVAELSQVKATVDAANAAVLSVEAKLVGVEAGKARANGDYQRWNAEHNRIKDLASRGTVTGKLVDESLNMLRSAEASLEEANAAIETTKATVDEARVNVRKTEADVFAAVARIDVAKANLSKARTMCNTLDQSPFRGCHYGTQRRPWFFSHVIRRYVFQAAARVSRHDIVRVFAEIPETEAELVTADGDTADPVTVTIQGLSNRSIAARVTAQVGH